MAIVWTHRVAGGSRTFFARAQHLHDHHTLTGATGHRGTMPEVEDLLPFTAELGSSPLVVDVVSQTFTAQVHYTRAQFTDLQRTYSATAALDPPRRETLLAGLGALIDQDFDGHVQQRYAFELVLARTTSTP